MATFGDLLAAAGQAVGDNKIDAKKAQEMIAAGDCIVLNVQDGSSKIPNAYDASLGTLPFKVCSLCDQLSCSVKEISNNLSSTTSQLGLHWSW